MIYFIVNYLQSKDCRLCVHFHKLYFKIQNKIFSSVYLSFLPIKYAIIRMITTIGNPIHNGRNTMNQPSHHTSVLFKNLGKLSPQKLHFSVSFITKNTMNSSVRKKLLPLEFLSFIFISFFFNFGAFLSCPETQHSVIFQIFLVYVAIIPNARSNASSS